MSGGRRLSRAVGLVRLCGDLLVALGFLAAVGTYLSFSEGGAVGLLIVLSSALAGLVYLLGCAIACAAWGVRRRWRGAIATALKAVAFVFLVGPCLRMGDYVHLALCYPAYRREIEVRGTENTKPVRFDWGDKALWVTDGFRGETLVYDPTDSLAASVGEPPWSDEHGFQVSTRRLIGRFYVEYTSSF